MCVAKSIRIYFQTGELPAAGALCEADLKPLVGTPHKAKTKDMNVTDGRLFDALMAEVNLGHWPGLPL